MNTAGVIGRKSSQWAGQFATAEAKVDDATLVRVAGLTQPLVLTHGAPLTDPPESAACTCTGFVYMIMDGRLRLYRRSTVGRETTLLILRAGDAFRFLARSANGAPASGDEALDRSALIYRFPAADLFPILVAHPATVLALMA